MTAECTLAPCRLCGGIPREFERFNAHVVTCGGCGLQVKQSAMGRGDAAERWNKLHGADQVSGASVALVADAAAEPPSKTSLSEAEVRQVYSLAEQWADPRVEAIRKSSWGPAVRKAHDALWEFCRGLQGRARGNGSQA